MLTNFVLGQTALSPEDPGFLLAIFDAFTNKQWWALAALGLGLLVYLAQRFGGPKTDFLKSILWSSVVGTALSFLLAVSHAAAAGQAVTAAVLFAALKIAAGSVPGKLLSGLAIDFFLKLIGIGPKADPEQLKAQASEAGKSAGASVTPLNSKDLVNKE